ncbi:MAG TPA: UDP-N-acetylmuramoyl-L-alanyl-D-glutamate--2,6-diaminopimelate ligase [Clostridiales bacterium]|nr:MAG: UDP-N-acetylmuramoyl-L-alanyl-D-glutamate--2,6-diaminopimelate ligase [Clostridiales bacterium GWD2_32_19]HCC07985.1 UDP-N-acetylmuramoyl-L-alanyl-D-glutamate--2,6-diaminopimelate ligase [Clostridiales bacterium]
MILKELLKDIEYELVQGNINIDIKSIEFDTRNIRENSLFTCMKRPDVDGHIYAQSAIDNGAVALLIEDELVNVPKNVTVIKVKNARAMTAYLSSALYEFPTRKFKLIGVTGTNGKTTTTFLIESILKNIGFKTGLIGTIEYHINDEVITSKNTTPFAPELQKLFYKMNKNNVEYAVMEVSSHALELNRADFCDFDIGIFTNLTQDHLDFHMTFENYKNSKLKLFEMCKHGIINIDDNSADYFIKNATCDIITYGIDKSANIMGKDIEISLFGTNFTLIIGNTEKRIKLKTPGKFSVYNALGAIAACYKLGIDIDKIAEGIELSEGVPGRFQTFISNNGFSVIVDYAHTPDGLENVLKTIRQFAKAKVITVFGCGGDRDKTKRPIMAKIASEYSTYCILTSDNPRTEEPEKILDDVEVGISGTDVSYERIADRKEAIKRALDLACAGDVVLIAGKGHEDYQILNTGKIHFSDVEEVKNHGQFNN